VEVFPVLERSAYGGLYLFFSFFFFFLNQVIIDLGTKSCMQLALWHINNLNSKN